MKAIKIIKAKSREDAESIAAAAAWNGNARVTVQDRGDRQVAVYDGLWSDASFKKFGGEAELLAVISW